VIGRAALAAAGVLALAGAGPAVAAEPILPLGQVTPGTVGEAVTVVRGNDTATFTVTVIDVLPDFEGLGPRILVRASGPLMDETGGIAQGMSGSPVYVTGGDGVRRVMGAVSFGTGDDEGVIGGVTPIELMLEDANRPATATVARPLAARRVARAANRAAAVAIERGHPGTRAMYPLIGWTASGVSAPTLRRLQRGPFGANGIRAVPGGLAASQQAGPIVPGSTFSAALAAGDIAFGAVGTTTYLTDDGRALAFGHGFLGTGPSRLMMGGGWVYQIIPTLPVLNASFKLAEQGPPVGMVVSDRLSGVAGRPGPVEAIAVTARTRHVASGRRTRLDVRVAPDVDLAPEMADVVQREAVFRALDGAVFGAGTVRIGVTLRSPRMAEPIVYENRYASTSDIALGPEPVAAQQVAILLRNSLAEVPISSVRIDQVVQPRVRAARIVGAQVAPMRARPGQAVRLRVLLQPWRASRRMVTVRYRVPRGARPGIHSIDLAPLSPKGGFVTGSFGGGGGEAISVGAGVRRAQRAAERALDSRADTRLGRIRTALLTALPKRHDGLRVQIEGAPATSVVLPYVLYGGSASATVQVVPRGRRARAG
jgi:hypothetical protein